jgi:uncharacterized protein (DUF849 family)
VAAAAADCERIGASVIDLEPRRDSALADVVAAVRDRTDLLVRITTRARSETLEQLLDVGADAFVCPLDSPDDFVVDLRERAKSQGIPLHFEARNVEELARLAMFSDADPAHAVLVFGGADGMPGDIQSFAGALNRLPPGGTFTAVGRDSASVPVMLASLAAGGCVRTGMADTLRYGDDVAARDNAQLVARAAGLAKIAQRPPLPSAQAAGVLGIGART